MKLHLPKILMVAVLACMAAPAQAAFSYLADGVDMMNLTRSERFYDNGKGLYWTYQSNPLYKRASAVYSSAGWSAFGQLYPRLARTSSFSVQSFANLKDDGNTCGYQVPVNLIQYWQSYYGVFYKGSEELPYGLNYAREYLDDFGGTQSLELGMLFYDNWQNSGNNLQYTSRWYMKGTSCSLLLDPASGGGGYFADYYGDSDACRYYYDLETLPALKDVLLSGFALQKQSDGSYISTEVGRLLYVGLSTPSSSGGHAITCYGFDLDANGQVKSLKMANSDDMEYDLFTVYVKESGGHIFLYTDEACTTMWKYAGYSWYITDIGHLETPDILKQLYAVYNDANTPLTWNGAGTRWRAGSTATTDALPTSATGWDVCIGDESYHSYYHDARPVRFDDRAACGDVEVYLAVKTPSMVLDNNALPYTFTGAVSAGIRAQQLCLSGGGSATFKDLTLTTGDLAYSNYHLTMGSGSTLRAGVCTVGAGGTLELADGNATLTSLTLGKGATLAVTGTWSTLATSVTLEEGSELYLVLSPRQTATSLFTVTGSLTLSGNVGLEIGGTSLVDGSTYMLCWVGPGDVNVSRFQSAYGNLSYSNNVLYLTYHALPSLAWSGGSGAWSSTSWQGTARDTSHAEVCFTGGSGIVTVSGVVNPHHITMSGGSYTLSGAGASVVADQDVTLSGSASLISNIPLTAHRYVLRGNAALTLNTGSNQLLNALELEEQTQLKLTGSGLTYTVGQVVAQRGTVSVGSGTTLAYRCADDSRMNGRISSANATSALMFSNASSTAPVTYHSGTSLSQFAGAVTVGADGDSQGTTLSVEMMPTVGSYSLRPNGTLELACSGALSLPVSGSGTLRFAEGMHSTVALSSGKPAYATSLALDVAGSLTIGSASSVSRYAVARALTVSGDLTVYTRSGTSTYSSLSLDGGRYSVCMPFVQGDFAAIIGNYNELSIGEKGGTISARHEGTAYSGQSYQAYLNQLSGSGNLVLEGSHFMGLTYYKIASLASSGYSGDITLCNTLSYTTTGNQVSLELGACTLSGALSLRTEYDDSLCRTTLGITANAEVGGLDSDGRGSASLYSGAISSFGADMTKLGTVPQIRAEEHTLTVNTATSHCFSGALMGALNIVKDGAGTQRFNGDIGSWSGSVNVKGGQLIFDQAVTLNSKLTMGGGTLQTERLVTGAGASFSGANTIVAGGVTDAAGWTLNVTLDNIDKAVLTLNSLGGSAGLSLRNLNICYDAETLADGSYKLLQYDTDFGEELEGVTLSGDCLSASIGSPSVSDVYYKSAIAGGKRVTILMLDVNNASGTLPRYVAATLTWVPTSGDWMREYGHADGVWKGSRNNNFYSGDTVIFDHAATVNISGAVRPDAVLVQNSSGTVVWQAKAAGATVYGAGTLTKSGAGAMTINTANSYSGGTTLIDGTLTAGHASAFGTGAIAAQGGTLAMGSYAIANNVSATGGTLTGTAYRGNLTVQGNVSLGSGFTAKSVELQSGTLSGSLTDAAVTALGGTLAAQVSGSASVTSNGTVLLSGINSYSGDTTVLGGQLSAGSASAFGTGTVRLNGGSLNMRNYAVSNAIQAQNGTLSGSAYTGALTVSSGSVRLSDGFKAGSLTLGGGTLAFDGTSGVSVSGVLSVQGATVLDVSAYTSAGTYTLISAGSFIGSSELLSCTTSAARLGGTLSQDNGALVLQLVSVGSDVYVPGGKGVWKEGSTFGNEVYYDGDSVHLEKASAITIQGQLCPGELVVKSWANVTLTADKKTPGSGLSGDGSVSKSGTGMLTLNAGNTYTGGTELNAGTIKATAADSFGTGDITVKSGTLDLGSKAVSNDIILSGTATLKGDAKYEGNVTVEGNATLLAKTSFKGMTTIGAGSSLTLAEKATMAGSLAVDGALTIRDAKGLTLAKNATLTLDGGSVNGLVTVGAGSTLMWNSGSMSQAPVIKGGTLDLGGEGVLTLTGSKAQVAFGDKRIDLPGKGSIMTDEMLTVTSGTVTVNALNGYADSIAVANGATLKLASKETVSNTIKVTGNAAVVNGKTHNGDIIVDGTLAKGTNIVLASGKTASLNGAGTMLGTISGAGTVDVNASIDATAAKLTASNINLNSGTFTNTKGIKLAKNQTLTLGGAKLNLGAKGALATVAGSTLVVNSGTTISGSLTLGGGELVFHDASLKVNGTLTLSKAMTVTGSGTIAFDTLKPFKGDLSTLFGGAEVEQVGNMLTITGMTPMVYSAAAPLTETPALPAENPVADAMVQADWGILDAERAFMGAVNTRYQHAALLDKGQGAAWVSAFGASVRHGNQGTHHGSDGTIEGAAFGLEHAVLETGTLGLAVGRSKNRIAATGVTHLRQETAHVALYGQKQLKHGFSADAAATYGDTETKLGAAAWQQKSAALTARLTHAQQLTDATAFRTFGGLSYEATESGSIGTVHTGSVQNLRAELGAGATHTAGKAHLYAEAALTGDMVRHNPTVDFGGARTHGANPGRIGVRATLGGLYEFSDTWSGTASYGIEAESRNTAHTLNIGVSKSF